MWTHTHTHIRKQFTVRLAESIPAAFLAKKNTKHPVQMLRVVQTNGSACTIRMHACDERLQHGVTRSRCVTQHDTKMRRDVSLHCFNCFCRPNVRPPAFVINFQEFFPFVRPFVCSFLCLFLLSSNKRLAAGCGEYLAIVGQIVGIQIMGRRLVDCST